MAYQLQAGKNQLVNVTHASFAIAPKKGTPGIKVRFADNQQHYIDHILWCTDNRLDATKKDLLTLGVDTARYKTFEEFRDQLPKDLIGAECLVTLEEEEYDGNWQTKVKWINESNPFPNADSSAVERMYGLFSGKSTATPPPKPPSAPPLAPGPQGEPF